MYVWLRLKAKMKKVLNQTNTFKNKYNIAGITYNKIYIANYSTGPKTLSYMVWENNFNWFYI